MVGEHQPLTRYYRAPVRDHLLGRCPPRWVEVLQRPTGPQPPGQPDPFQVPVGVAQRLPVGYGQPARGDPFGVAGGVLDVPPAHPAEVTVRARSRAEPVAAVPVAEVVSAPGGIVGRPVGYLVP